MHLTVAAQQTETRTRATKLCVCVLHTPAHIVVSGVDGGGEKRHRCFFFFIAGWAAVVRDESARVRCSVFGRVLSTLLSSSAACSCVVVAVVAVVVRVVVFPISGLSFI